MPQTAARSRAAAYLSSRVRFGIKFGLETMRALCEELHHPERAFASLLVAGTNGKGSVVAYADAALRASGLAVGRYTSPHLVRVNERI
ncbi:MAG TPA: bifunctional folylpolyglutamate synthase/dihydrofolate synthase, partial [Vicinamibacteria bacterium]|nr:bifunctional folylpolyglutamate synthase/dihydrofolate synthase [Vicinamibacteria bacterium]